MKDTLNAYPTTKAKMIQYDYDWLLSLTGECEVCLTVAQVQAILAMVDYLGWRTRWFSENGTVDEAIIQEFRDDLTRRLIMSCCGDNEIQRMLADGTIEISIDDGVTWTPVTPGQDPRQTGSYLPVPPDSGTDDGKCIQANSFVSALKGAQGEAYNQRQNGATAAQIAAALIAFLVAVGVIATGGALALFLAAIGAIVTNRVAAEWNDAFSDAVWADLLCLVLEKITADAEISQDDALEIAYSIRSMHPGDAGNFLHDMITSMGAVGCTNAIRQGAGGALGCDCGVCGFRTSAEDGNWDRWDLATADLLPEHFPDKVRIQHGGTGYFEANGYCTSPNQQIGIVTEFAEPCLVLSVNVYNLGTPNNYRIAIYYRVGASWIEALSETGSSHSGGDAWSATIGVEVDAIQIMYNDCQPAITVIAIS